MNKFDALFISNIKVNNLTEEEVNNLRTQRGEINKIINSYETNKTDIQSAKNELYVGEYFKYIIHDDKVFDDEYVTYIKILSANPINYLEFNLYRDSQVDNINHYYDDYYNYFDFDDDFFNLEENDELNFDNLIEITEEEFNAAMDRKYQEFKQELSNIPYNNEKN